MSATYIVPIRLGSCVGIAELAAYLRTLRDVQILVVDGSAPKIFAAVEDAVRTFACHVSPTGPGLNGKARGVLTGLSLAMHDEIVVADDDVRYDAAALRSILGMLTGAEVVRPQNYFLPTPWHAVLDSSRSLINRALDGDWPGTLAFRRSALPNGYNPDVLFENFELVRTIRARGGVELVARGLFIARRPPTLEHFFGQRVRQAYDEFARPARLIAALAILPVIAGAWAIAGPVVPVAFALVASGCAAVGWLRDGGHRYFSILAVAAAPLWVLERAVCAWLAVYERWRFGGVRYGDCVIRDAASRGGAVKQWVT